MTQQSNKPDSLDEHLLMAVDAAQIGIWELDTVTGSAWRNARHDRIFGYEEMLPSWTLDEFIEHVAEDDRAKVRDAYSAALESKTDWAFECRINRSDGLVRWISATGKHLPGGNDKNERLIGHVIDITETKRSEEHLRLVTGELNHRLQNIIGTIGGLVRMTARKGGYPVEFAETIEARLAALGRGHNLTFRDRTGKVSIEEALLAERSAMPEFADRVIIDVDPKLTLSAPLVERLILVTHELATNAIKYGALSVPEGRVLIDSQVDPKTLQVTLTWRETGGPAVEAPTRQGFGTTLIKTALSADAKISQDFAEAGLVCRITFPPSTVSTKA